MQLNPMHLTIANLLDGRLFRIPEYQRAYSWQKKQRTDLFRDIREAHSSGGEHFMATIVALSRGVTKPIGADEYKIVELVDGQQRVTTIVILLKAIELALSADDKQVVKMKTDLSELLVKSDDHEMILLQTNHDSSSVFKDYIKTGTISQDESSTAADQNLIDAAKECARFVETWQQNDNLVDLYGTIRNRLSVIFHEITDERIVYRVFEVLNSRGLDVKWIDKTKSQLMASIFEHTNDKQGQEDGLHDMHTIWKDIYQKLGLRQDLGDEALRFAGTFAKSGEEPKKILSDEKASQEMQRVAGKEINTLINCASDLRETVKAVRHLHDNPRLRAVTKILHARFLAVAIYLRKFDEAEEAELINAWERVTFRIFGLGYADARNMIADYVQLGCAVHAKTKSVKKILKAIRKIGADYPIDEIIEGPKYWDECYKGWTEELRYVLYRYDEHLAVNGKINVLQWEKIWQNDASSSIEHITPQNSGRSYIHNIGNLTMLTPRLNSSLGGKSPNEKAERYIDEGLLGTIQVGKKIKNSQKWTKADVVRRKDEIEAFVKAEWAD